MNPLEVSKASSESPESVELSPSSLSPLDYLETYVFPSLLPAIEALLKHISPQTPATMSGVSSKHSLTSLKDDASQGFQLNPSPILFLAQHLARHNPQKTSESLLTTSSVAKIAIPSSIEDLQH